MIARMYRKIDNNAEAYSATCTLWRVEPQRGDLFAVVIDDMSLLVRAESSLSCYSQPGCKAQLWRDHNGVPKGISFGKDLDTFVACYYFHQ